MYALVEIKGKQFKAEEGAVLKVATIDLEAGKTVEFESVLMVRADDKISFGGPYVKGAKITAEVVSHGKEDKIIVSKYKRRKDYRRKQGHRQEFTMLRVKSIKV